MEFCLMIKLKIRQKKKKLQVDPTASPDLEPRWQNLGAWSTYTANPSPPCTFEINRHRSQGTS